MANNCYNEIILEGNKESIQELRDRLTDTYDKFNYLNGWCDYVLKVRDDFDYNFEEDKRDHYFYGSRWFNFDIEGDSNDIQLRGDSAWSPMEKFVEEICKVYNLIGSIEYSEEGCDFAGITEFDSDGETKREEYSYEEYEYIYGTDSWVERNIEFLEGESKEDIDDFVKEASKYASKEHIYEILAKLN
tara:strand:- start:375 stop:938 length:564 start_codon:yes stop_codon:yes gene_type:complete